MTKAAYSISKTPIQITQAGESGTCWLQDGFGVAEGIDIFVYHNGRSVDEGIRVFPRTKNSEVLVLTADDSADYFHAVSKSGTGKLVVDVI